MVRNVKLKVIFSISVLFIKKAGRVKKTKNLYVLHE